jgi:adenylate cyclase
VRAEFHQTPAASGIGRGRRGSAGGWRGQRLSHTNCRMVGERTNRRLAAVLAADVVGYSRMMGADEAGTLAALEHHRQQVFNPAVREHRGRVVKLIGDGTLVEFGSVVDAVLCAVAIQSAPRGNGDAGKPIVLRIGVNLGDVIIQGDDIYGEGVNVAARLEPLAEPGGICIASIVHESIGNRIDAQFSDGGEVSVKNIDRPIRVWRWHPGNIVASGPAASVRASAAPASIAVMPFTNMSGDPAQEYFSDGITEDIITDLSKVGGLMVIARNSSFAYKHKAFDVRTVGRELGVTSVLEGSMRRAGNRVRITAQLIDATTGGHIWAERYDRDLTDIFAVQDDVTRRIVDALKVKLTRSEAARIADAPTDNLDAHDLVLRGRALMVPSMDRKMYAEATELFTRALALDPAYSQAFALLAAAHMLDFINRWSEEPDASLDTAGALSDKAIAADPNEPTGHLLASWVAMIHRDYEKAQIAIDRALPLEPNSAFALNARGTLAIYLGRPEAAIPDLERAMQLDPAVSQQYLHFLGVAHLLMGHDETAAAMFRERIRLVPETDFSRSMLAAALGHLNQVDEARRMWAELMKVNPRYSFAEHIARMPFKDPAYASRIREGLAKSGLRV